MGFIMRPNRIVFALSGALLGMALAGCGDKKEDAAPPAAPPVATQKFTEPAPTSATAPTDKMASAAPNTDAKPVTPGSPDAPFASKGDSKMAAEDALKQVPTLDPKYAPMDKTLRDKEAALKQSPNDPKAKSAYVEAAYNYGHTLMISETTAPKAVQYRGALALFRRALKVDPKHQPSLDESETIINIYKSLGWAIPQ